MNGSANVFEAVGGRGNEVPGHPAVPPAGTAQWGPLADICRALVESDDERQVLRRLAAAACELSGWGACVVAVADAEGLLHAWASAGLSAATDKALRNRPIPTGTYQRLWRAGRTAGPMRCVSTDHPVFADPDVLACFGPEPGPGSLCVVSLLSVDGTLLGFLSLDRPPDGAPTGDAAEVACWSVLADLAVTAIRLTTARANERSRGYLADGLLRAVARVRSSLQLEQVLADIAAAMTATGGFERVAINLLGDDRTTLHTVATAGMSAREAQRLRANPTPLAALEPIMRPAMRVSRSYLFDHRYFDLPPDLLELLSVPERAAGKAEGGAGAGAGAGRWHPLDSLSVPLVDERRELLGIISVDEPWDGRLPDLAHIQALEFFADQAAVAIGQAREHEQLAAQAHTDPLTGLANRAVLLDALPRTLADAARAGRQTALLFCDLDHFKAVNDSYGHNVGDEVLRCVADAAAGQLRSDDLLARYGGEEFVVMAPNTGAEQAAALAERLRTRIAQLRATCLPPGLVVNVSIGVAVSRPPAPAPAEAEVDWAHEAHLLLAAADRLLYEAKQRGRNQVRLTA
jgi:diguanylate cyclase (GGDEF)-like protein